MKPGDVADLPQHGIDDAQFRAHELIVVEPGDQRHGARVRIADDGHEIVGGYGLDFGKLDHRRKF